LKINSCFLKHNYYTDIITFDLSDSPEIISAEVYISPVRVKENAIQFRTTYSNEIHRVIIHGVLHLCGYADKIKKDILEMRKAEDKYLSLYFK
jgi:rRNA maturation RNase YbeY